MKLNGRIHHINGNQLVINCNVTDETRNLINYSYGKETEIQFDDDKHITIDQRKKIFVMIHEFAEHTGNWGNNPLDKRRNFKEQYSDEYAEYVLKNRFRYVTGYFHYFSFSNCSRELASRFIEFLIDICLQYDVNFKTKFIDSIRGNYKFEWYCYKNMKCEVCGVGKETDAIEIAHVHSVGMGRDRESISHIGNRIMILCYTHHQVFQHLNGIKTFMNRYQLKGIEVTPDVARRLKLGHYGGNHE